MKFVLGLTVAASVLVAGCGGGSKTSTSNTTSTTVAGTAARQAYITCLANHGVTLPQRGQRQAGQAPDSSTTPTSINPKMQAARQACASLRPAGGFGGGGGFGGARANTPQAQAYRSCLQQHGVTFSSSPTGNFNFNDPTFQAAQQACASLRPTFNSTTTTSG